MVAQIRSFEKGKILQLYKNRAGLLTILTGRRHVDILGANAVLREGITVSSIAGGEQGFLTGDGSFLNRELAAEHVLKCGQIKKTEIQQDSAFLRGLVLRVIHSARPRAVQGILPRH